MEVEYHEVSRASHCICSIVFPFSRVLNLTCILPGAMDGWGEQEYVRNSRGVQLFTCGWLPAKTSPKALVFLCHGTYVVLDSKLDS